MVFFLIERIINKIFYDLHEYAHRTIVILILHYVKFLKMINLFETFIFLCIPMTLRYIELYA